MILDPTFCLLFFLFVFESLNWSWASAAEQNLCSQIRCLAQVFHLGCDAWCHYHLSDTGCVSFSLEKNRRWYVIGPDVWHVPSCPIGAGGESCSRRKATRAFPAIIFPPKLIHRWPREEERIENNGYKQDRLVNSNLYHLSLSSYLNIYKMYIVCFWLILVLKSCLNQGLGWEYILFFFLVAVTLVRFKREGAKQRVPPL